MRNKLIIAAVELAVFHLLSLFLVYELFLSDPAGQAASVQADESIIRYRFGIFAAAYIIGMLLLGFHIYLNMVRPASKAQKNLEWQRKKAKRQNLSEKSS